MPGSPLLNFAMMDTVISWRCAVPEDFELVRLQVLDRDAVCRAEGVHADQIGTSAKPLPPL